MLKEIIAILDLLAATSAHFTDRQETAEERRARLEPTAEAIWLATEVRPTGLTRLQQAANLLSIGKHEAWWATYVQNGKCAQGPAGSRCDPNARGEARARSFWQLWRPTCPALWEMEQGTPLALKTAARCASVHFTAAWNRCAETVEDDMAGAFSGYRATPCDWAPATERAETARAYWIRLDRRFHQLRKEEQKALKEAESEGAR